MCRYGVSGPYKPHLACFACRKSFKRQLLADVDPSGVDRPARCPQCAGPMASMGLDFAPPPARDVGAWRVLADLWTIGETFHSCGCGGPGYRPRSPAAYADYLRAIEASHAATLGQWERQTIPDVDPARAGQRPAEIERRRRERELALGHWRARLSAVRAAMIQHGVAR